MGKQGKEAVRTPQKETGVVTDAMAENYLDCRQEFSMDTSVGTLLWYPDKKGKLWARLSITSYIGGPADLLKKGSLCIEV